MIEAAVDLYVSCIEYALPFAVVFSLGNLICHTILSAAFGGRLHF